MKKRLLSTIAALTFASGCSTPKVQVDESQVLYDNFQRATNELVAKRTMESDRAFRNAYVDLGEYISELAPNGYEKADTKDLLKLYGLFEGCSKVVQDAQGDNPGFFMRGSQITMEYLGIRTELEKRGVELEE